MLQHRRLAGFLFVLGCLIAPTRASAQTANFDQLTAATDWRNPSRVPDGYAGKNWRYFGVFDANSGFGDRALSGPNYAYAFCCPVSSTNPTVTSSDGGTFDFISAYVFTVQNTNYLFDVYGFDATNTVIYSKSIRASGQTEVFNFVGVTSVLFQNNYEANLGLDDMKFSGDGAVVSTPEPASLVLLSTGLMGIMGAARRRSRS